MKANQDCPTKLLPEFLNDSLGKKQAQSIEEHLESCERCRAKLESESGGTAFWSTIANLSDDALDRDWSDCHPTFDPSLESKSVEQCRAERLTAIFATVKPLLSPSDDPQSAGRIGNHEVTGIIGSGGMGVVVKARDRSLDRVVAIKMLAPHLAAFESSRKRFRREAKAAAAVQHDGIISIHGVDAHNGIPYFVMPYEAGPSLQQRIESEGRLTVEETLRVASQIASALHAAHQTGLVHRDIKPSNILLAPGTERALLTDFGLAQVCDQQNITQTGLVAGTPMFMSPEQARGETVDSRSDLFSLGSVMFMMLTGQPPVSGDTGYSVIRQIGDHAMTSIGEIDSSLPEWLDRLVSRLHQRDPADRIQTAKELSVLLNQSLAHQQNPAENALPVSLCEKQRTSGRSFVFVSIAAIVAVGVFVFLFNQDWFAIQQPSNRNANRNANPSANHDNTQAIQTSDQPSKQSDVIEPFQSNPPPLLGGKVMNDDWEDGLDSMIQDIQIRLEQVERDQKNEDHGLGRGTSANEDK